MCGDRSVRSRSHNLAERLGADVACGEKAGDRRAHVIVGNDVAGFILLGKRRQFGTRIHADKYEDSVAGKLLLGAGFAVG